MSEALRATLRARFEIDEHPLQFAGRVGATGPAGCVVERLAFRAGDGEAVRGVLCRPDHGGRMPAVLVIHAHGNAYGIGASELMAGRPALQGPLGPALAGIGIASLCLDMPCFGERAGTGESGAAKAALWRGRSLAGRMLGENASAIDWLEGEAWVQPGRIGVFGISMGATLGYWLAAVEARVTALAQLCCFADFGRLIETGAHDLHGIYLTVPGLLAEASNGAIAGLVAPRPQFIGIGDEDPLTPPHAVDPALAEVRAAYGGGEALVVHREAGLGHAESPAMRAGVLDFLARALRV